MELLHLYTRFPTQEACITFLEKIRWNGTPTCPYCTGINITLVAKEQRYHCNRCKTSFSVTVNTIFHKSRIDLRKWVLAIMLYLESDRVSAQHLARVLEVNKNTAWYMKERLRREAITQQAFMQAISKGV